MKSDAASHQTVNPNPKFRQFEGAKVRARIKLIQTFKKKITTQFARQCLETARYCRARQLRWPPVGSTTQWRRSCFFCHNQRRASPAWGSPSRIQCHHRKRCTRRTLAILRLLQQRKWNHHVRAKPRERTSLLLSLLWLALHHVFIENLVLLYDPAPSFCFVSLVSCVPSCSSLSAASSRLLLPVHSLTFLPWVLPSNFRPTCRMRASRFQQRCNSFSFSSSSSSLLLSSPLFSSASGRMPQRMTDRMFEYYIYIT